MLCPESESFGKVLSNDASAESAADNYLPVRRFPSAHAHFRMPTSDELQPLEVVLRPARFCLDHAFEGLRRERVAWGVECYRNSSSVWVSIYLVGAGASVKSKAVTDKRGDDFAGRQLPQMGIVNAHRSDVHSYPRLDRNLHVLCVSFGQLVTVLKHARNHELDHFVDVP
jgi:hypothetical protein